jgi:hypothetical protein
MSELAELDAQIDWLRNHWGIGENHHGRAIRLLERRRKQLWRQLNPSLLDTWRENWRIMPGLFGPARLLHTIELTRQHYKARKK